MTYKTHCCVFKNMRFMIGDNIIQRILKHKAFNDGFSGVFFRHSYNVRNYSKIYIYKCNIKNVLFMSYYNIFILQYFVVNRAITIFFDLTYYIIMNSVGYSTMRYHRV